MLQIFIVSTPRDACRERLNGGSTHLTTTALRGFKCCEDLRDKVWKYFIDEAIPKIRVESKCDQTQDSRLLQVVDQGDIEESGVRREEWRR